MIEGYGYFALQALEIVWINLLLSGDNALVIALACRSLPKDQRSWGIGLGAAAAVILRIGFSIVVADVSMVPYLRLVGGMLLLWIAVQLVSDVPCERMVSPCRSLWSAVRTIVVADLVMSLDNVVAIAMAAKNSIPLIVFGLGLSIPLVVCGSALVLRLITRFPHVIWGGAALLGWIAGDIISDDPVVIGWAGSHARAFDAWAPLLFAVVALACTWLAVRHRQRAPGAA
jgi:YjbE family integral membrane protein